MAKDTRIAFRASADLKQRLQKASKKVKLGETALAEAAVEAAVEYIEQHGGIWFPLRVVPEPNGGEPKPKLPEVSGKLPTGIHAPDVGLVSPSRSSARHSLNEDAADEGAKPRGEQPPQPAPRMTRTRAALRSMAKKKTEK